MIKVAFVEHVPGHKNSKGEPAPWVVKQHDTGKILSSHGSKDEAVKHLRDIEGHKNSFVGVQDIEHLLKTAYGPTSYEDTIFLVHSQTIPDRDLLNLFLSGSRFIPYGGFDFEFRMMVPAKYPVYLSANKFNEYILSIFDKFIRPLGLEEAFNSSLTKKIRDHLPEYVKEFKWGFADKPHPLEGLFKDLEGKQRTLKINWHNGDAGEIIIQNIDITLPFTVFVDATDVISDKGYWTERLI